MHLFQKFLKQNQCVENWFASNIRPIFHQIWFSLKKTSKTIDMSLNICDLTLLFIVRMIGHRAIVRVWKFANYFLFVSMRGWFKLHQLIEKRSLDYTNEANDFI